jgi:hypothetical protein
MGAACVIAFCAELTEGFAAAAGWTDVAGGLEGRSSSAAGWDGCFEHADNARPNVRTHAGINLPMVPRALSLSQILMAFKMTEVSA